MKLGPYLYILTILLSAFLIPTAVFAQCKAGDIEVSGSYGFLSAFERQYIGIIGGGSEYTDVNSTNNVFVGARIYVSPRIAIGLEYGSVSFSAAHYDEQFFDAVNPEWDLRQRNRTLAATILYNYVNHKNIRIYAYVGAGTYHEYSDAADNRYVVHYPWGSNQFTPAPFIAKEYQMYTAHFCPFGLSLGRRLSISAELPGIGYKGMFTFAASYRFGFQHKVVTPQMSNDVPETK